MGSEKRGEITAKKITGLRLFAAVVIIMIAGAVAAGLYLSGTPGKERSRQFDARRLNDLQMIAQAVDSFYGRNNRLPNNLDVLVSAAGKEGYLIGNLSDPQPDRGGYEYNPAGETDYELCAVFDLPSDQAENQNLRQPPPPKETAPVAEPAPLVTELKTKGRIRTWEHGAGRFCFSLNATDVVGSVTCGLRAPCQAGQTCAALPENKGTVCVPQGHECEAAGCPGQCALAESYPVQVTCDTSAAAAPAKCRLLKNIKTGAVDCFGCAQGVCRQATSDWETFVAPQKPDYVGIPYACFEGPQGCELAQ